MTCGRRGGHQQPGAYCGLRRGRELPEEHKVLWRWCEALGQKYRGQRLAGLAHEIFLMLNQGEAGSARCGGEAEDPGRAGRQVRAVRLRADGGHLRAGPRGAGEAAFAGSVQTLQALCGDCRSKKTLRESAQPTSLESRVAPGVMEYARSPKLPPLVFDTCRLCVFLYCFGERRVVFVVKASAAARESQLWLAVAIASAGASESAVEVERPSPLVFAKSGYRSFCGFECPAF